jgi:hypothetical protein
MTDACSSTKPVCDTGNKTCAGCNGDNSQSSTLPCVGVNKPYCILAIGACGTCSSNSDCGADHAGPICNATTHACGALCTTDTDCSGRWCNNPSGAAAAGTCADKYANPQPLPSVAPISSTCSTAVGARVCVSGVCNTGDNACGYDLGGGPCTGGNAATVCRSGFCGSSSGSCIPQGGCASDGDCPAQQYCNGSGFSCVDQLPNGSTLPSGDPLHSAGCDPSVGAAVCASGRCDSVDNGCGLSNGVGSCSVSNDPVCRSGACGSDHSCGLVNGQGPCTPGSDSTVCRSGSCGRTSATCVPAGGCTLDADCLATEFCITGSHSCSAKLVNSTPLPVIAGHVPSLDGICTADVAKAVCASGACDATSQRCGIDIEHGTCSGNTQCNEGACVSTGPNAGKCKPCVSDASCSAATPVCEAQSNHCVECAGANAAKCSGATPVCDSSANKCKGCNGDYGQGASSPCPNGVNPFCAADGSCGLCGGNSDCAGNHAGPICAVVSGACGVACTRDADCPGKWCNNATSAPGAGSCSPKIGNGLPVPSVVPILGMCTAEAASRVCSSGVCGTGDNLCGVANSQVCSSDAVCRSGICNADGKCGDPTSSNCSNASTCRSGICYQDGACGEPNGAICVSASECRSGVCRAADGMCGLLNGEPCTEASARTCRSAVCYQNLCGIPNGQTCSSGDPCRSETCVAGHCASSCSEDSQCGQGAFCDAAVLRCVRAFPESGSCARGAQCLGGVCGTDNKCGALDGTGCTANAACRGGLCGEGGCGTGLPLGTTCSSSSTCLSGVCAADGKCGALTGRSCSNPGNCRFGICDGTTGTCRDQCAGDADCAAAQFCSSGACVPDAVNGDAPMSSTGKACDRGEQCLSGVCNLDRLCGQRAGDVCGSSLLCRSNVCDSEDSRCGLLGGNGPCNASVVCRSGVCDTVTGKCGHPNGAGSCTTSTAAVMCQARACNAADSTCGVPEGGDCTNGTACHSGMCDTSTHKCIRCTRDLDCGKGSFCEVGGCYPGRANGGDCGRPTQCVVSYCARDNKCGKLDGEVCGKPEECRGRSCVGGHCGSSAGDAGVEADASGDASLAPDAGGGASGRGDVVVSVAGGGMRCAFGAPASNRELGLGWLVALGLLVRRSGGRRRKMPPPASKPRVGSPPDPTYT